MIERKNQKYQGLERQVGWWVCKECGFEELCGGEFRIRRYGCCDCLITSVQA